MPSFPLLTAKQLEIMLEILADPHHIFSSIPTPLGGHCRSHGRELKYGEREVCTNQSSYYSHSHVGFAH